MGMISRTKIRQDKSKDYQDLTKLDTHRIIIRFYVDRDARSNNIEKSGHIHHPGLRPTS